MKLRGHAIAERAGQLLKSRGWRAGVAESSTGGLLGHLITSVPGSSAYFWGGVIAYDNAVKAGLLEVRDASLIRWGAVSHQVALEMAEGARRALGVEVGISITGIAGPGGGSPQKPVGLFFIGLAFPGERRSWRHLWTSDREENNQVAAETALHHLVRYLHPA